jgi:hypothetical protein
MEELEQEQEPVPERRRSLDELFADEPFLSPTMKAKRLFDRLQSEDEESVAPDAVVSEAIPTSTGYSSFPDHLEPQVPFAGNTLISMTAARVIIGEQSKEGGTPLPGEPANLSMLRALHERMLSPWLRNITADL